MTAQTKEARPGAIQPGQAANGKTYLDGNYSTAAADSQEKGGDCVGKS